MAHLVEVAFRGNRKEFFAWEGETPPPLRAPLIVEVDRGEDFGRVHSTGELAEVRCRGCAHGCGTTPPPRRALRLATPDEVRRDHALTADNETARRQVMARVKTHGLVMKVTDAEWQFDRRKLTIHFTAEKRVDFRDLVRDLATHFHARIELKQIGVRDEAKRLGGIGRCGREYCSASWMQELRPVNLGVAKDQKLSLNPQQISGACGRLMCCLRHEHDFYVQSRRRFPKEGKRVVTRLGEELVVACDIFNERVTLRSTEGELRVLALADYQSEVGGGDPAVAAPEAIPLAVAAAEAAAAATVARATVLETLPLEETRRLLDTSEFRVVLGALAPTDAPEPDGSNAVLDGRVALSSDELLPESAADDADEEESSGDDDEPSTASSAATADPPRRKRRRGKRGGRRRGQQ